MSQRKILHLVTDPTAKSPICEVCRMPVDENFRDHKTDNAIIYGTGVDGIRSCKFVLRELLFPKEETRPVVESVAPPKVDRASEAEWLMWFYQNADFGPADSDVRDSLKSQFKRGTGKLLPEGYNYNSSTGERED